MKVLFLMRSTIYVRNFESTLRLLAERGHEVHVVADRHALDESNDLIGRLCDALPGVRYSPPPVTSASPLALLGLELRRALDYLRYLGPEFAEAPKLRARAERNAPAFVAGLLALPMGATAAGRAVLARLLRWADRAVPAESATEAFVRAHDPDLVLVTPLVEPGAPQAEFLRAARACGIPTGLCVYSWDNLTNKGLIHDPLDIVTVWNDAMKREAVALHGVPPERVAVTGSPAYDHWFDWRPGTTRDAFCSQAGLPADRPYVLYLCSSKFITPHEVPFIRRWVSELRAASPALRETAVLVRPHPQNAEQWASADLSDLEHVAVWPRAGANPVDADSRGGYYDSIHHSAAVVGINTSAQIESAIVGRGVYTVLADEFRDTQDGTLHFRHLRDVNGGLLHVGDTFASHAVQLEAAVTGRADDRDRCRRFVEAFVRPHGLDVAAAPRLVSVLEATAAGGRTRPDRGPWWGGLVRPILARLAVRVAGTTRGRKEKAARQDRQREARHSERTERRAALTETKRAADRERAERRDREAAEAERARQAQADAAARAYGHYLHVRGWVRAVREAGAAVPLSAAEQQMITALAPLDDATPETIARLRHWCEPISGVRPQDYDPLAPEVKHRLKRDLAVRRRRDTQGLFVAEPPWLGGFGYLKGGETYNEDTLRHFKVLVALQDSAVLADVDGTGGRRLVWEIGGGWGGLAHHVKTLRPNVTYLITGHPEVLLVAAIYLMTMWPSARVHLHGPGSGCDPFHEWEQTDFILAPEASLFEDASPPGTLSGSRPPRLDLAIDMAALCRMDAARVRRHVRLAYEWGARYIYSQQPAAADASVAAAIEPYFWPHPVPPLSEDAASDGADADDVRMVGWRRLRV
jgi:hypothetical protein